MITTFAYPASRGYIFTGWAGVQKVASADNCSIFYCVCTKFVIAIRKQIIVRCVVKWHEFHWNKKIATTLICWARLTQDSCNALNQSRTEKKPGFFNLFVQISGQIWTVVSRGYFSHDSSNSENVASAHRVTFAMLNNIICRA